MILYRESNWAKVYLGDCLEMIDYLDPRSVDLAILDPPFERPAQILEWIVQLKDILTPGGIAAHFGPVWDLKNILNRMTKWFSLLNIVCLERTGGSWSPIVIVKHTLSEPVKFKAIRTDGMPWDLKRIYADQRPYGIISWIVQTYSKLGDLVLDPFMGSGVTGVACKEFDRKFIGIEISRERCSRAARLLEI